MGWNLLDIFCSRSWDKKIAEFEKYTRKTEYGSVYIYRGRSPSGYDNTQKPYDCGLNIYTQFMWRKLYENEISC